MAIVKCKNCGKDVSDKARECPHCQAIVNDTNELENVLYNFKEKGKRKNENNVNTRKIYNKVATKFNIVVYIIRIIGYFSGFVSLIILAQNNSFLLGLVVCVITCIVTWLSTLFFVAIAEGLQLLQDIKEKL